MITTTITEEEEVDIINTAAVAAGAEVIFCTIITTNSAIATSPSTIRLHSTANASSR